LSLRLLKRADVGAQQIGGMLFLICSWIFLHSLGENWGVLGDTRMLPILGATVGIALARAHSEQAENVIARNNVRE